MNPINNGKKLLYISNRNYPNHDSRIVELFTMVLPENGFKVLVIAKTTAENEKVSVWNKAALACFYTRLPKFLEVIKYYLFVIKKSLFYKYLVIGNKTFLTIVLAIIFPYKKIVYEKNFPDEENFLHFYKNKKIFDFKYFFYIFALHLVKYAINFSKLTVVMSDSMRDFYINKYKLKTNFKIIPIQMGVNAVPINNSSEKKYDFCYVGELREERNPRILFEIFYLLKQKKYDLKAVLVGASSIEPINYFDKYYQAFNLNKNDLIITGWIPGVQVQEYIQQSKIGLSEVPSIEIFKISSPTKIAEYLNCGIPVVGNQEIIDQDYIIKQSGAGISVPYQADSFADAIEKLLNLSNEKRQEMGQRGLNYIRKNRTNKILGDKLAKKLWEI